MDSLSAILGSVRLASTAISCGAFSAPWSVRTEGAPSGIFHAILEGAAWIVADGAPGPVRLEQGDVIVLPAGSPHTIGDDPRTAPVHIRELSIDRSRGGIGLVRHGGRGAVTRIFCGTFHLDHDAESSLLSLLPPLMHVPAPREPSGEPTSATLRLLDHEIASDAPGSSTMILRLCDVLFVQVLREHIAASPAGARGWLAALRDEHVGKALALIHENPAERWDARLLAARAGTSRSRLFARFTALVGEPPARYVARWRILAAADMLGRRNATVAAIAERVGYSSEDAFIKAFKRHLGASPSEYRRKRSPGPRGTPGGVPRGPAIAPAPRRNGRGIGGAAPLARERPPMRSRRPFCAPSQRSPPSPSPSPPSFAGCADDPKSPDAGVPGVVFPQVKAGPIGELEPPPAVIAWGGADSVEKLAGGLQALAQQVTPLVPPVLETLNGELRRRLALTKLDGVDWKRPARLAVFDPKGMPKAVLALVLPLSNKDQLLASLPP